MKKIVFFITHKTLDLYHAELCFIVHKYHDITSVNRTSNREVPVHGWLNS